MLWHKHSDEFSIILLLDAHTTEDIKLIRHDLPPSPYRDDRPHTTLLRGVRTPRPMSDAELYNRLRPTLNSLLGIKPHARIRGFSNLAGGFYRRTSAILLNSEKLTRDRLDLVKDLRAEGFKIGRHQKRLYPHATIRLGVPLDIKELQRARELLPVGREVNFSGWVIYRLISKRGKRLFYEVKV